MLRRVLTILKKYLFCKIAPCNLPRSFLRNQFCRFLCNMIGLVTQVSALVTLSFFFSLFLARLFILKFIKKPQNSVVVGENFLFSIAFFHPYCNACGGGERVLWMAIKSIQEKYPDILCVVYTGDINLSPNEILERAKQRFNIEIPHPVQFVFLKKRRLVEADLYPYFTLLGQSLGSIVLGLEALLKFVPDVYIDSMGYAFTLPLFKLLGACKVGCYVHYPTISTDMLEKVSEKVTAHNNRSFISKSPILTKAKLVYYHVFAFLYGLAGKCSDIVAVNSTWTKNHVAKIWKLEGSSKLHLVYPPCGITEFKTIPINEEAEKSKKEWRIISVAQFRPEKDHPLQIKAFTQYLSKCSEEERKNSFLVLVGSCRTEDDDTRVRSLRKLCRDMEVENKVLFRLNIPFHELKDEMEKSSVGIHSMWNEHFGIGVVEMMAAGVLILAHNSGGPKMDIVKEYDRKETGFLADSIDSYADTLLSIKKMPVDKILDIKRNARESVQRFSDEEFTKSFISFLEKVL